jgi:hypothetical protein
MTTCRRTFYIEGSAQPGTSPSVYDPSNILGGARYTICDKPGFSIGRSGAWLCEQHAQEEKEFLERNKL